MIPSCEKQFLAFFFCCLASHMMAVLDRLQTNWLPGISIPNSNTLLFMLGTNKGCRPTLLTNDGCAVYMCHCMFYHYSISSFSVGLCLFYQTKTKNRNSREREGCHCHQAVGCADVMNRWCCCPPCLHHPPCRFHLWLICQAGHRLAPAAMAASTTAIMTSLKAGCVWRNKGSNESWKNTCMETKKEEGEKKGGMETEK